MRPRPGRRGQGKLVRSEKLDAYEGRRLSGMMTAGREMELLLPSMTGL